MRNQEIVSQKVLKLLKDNNISFAIQALESGFGETVWYYCFINSLNDKAFSGTYTCFSAYEPTVIHILETFNFEPYEDVWQFIEEERLVICNRHDYNMAENNYYDACDKYDELTDFWGYELLDKIHDLLD